MHRLRYWQVPRCGLCASGAVRCADAADRQLALELLRHRLLQVSLDAVQIHRRQELAVGQLRQPFGAAAHADEALDLVVPRRELGVADRPVDCDPVLGVRAEIQVAPAIGLPAPHQRAAADVVAADPVEALDLGVRMLGVVDEPVLRGLRDRVAAAGSNRLPLQVFVGGPAPVGKLPDVLGRRRVVAVLHVAAAVQHQRFQALLRELFGGPAAGDAGADDDGIVGMVFGRGRVFWRICHSFPRYPAADFTSSVAAMRAVENKLHLRPARRARGRSGGLHTRRGRSGRERGNRRSA